MKRHDKIRLSLYHASRDRVKNLCLQKMVVLFCNSCGDVIGFTDRETF